MLKKVIGIVVRGTILVFGGWVLLQCLSTGWANELSVSEKHDLRVDKYIKENVNQEAIRITNLGRAPIAIKAITLNNKSTCLASNNIIIGVVLGMGDFRSVWPCINYANNIIVEVKIETDHGTATYLWQ